MNELSKYLKELRKTKEKSIRKAAEEAKISHTYLSTLEKGYDPRTNNVRKPTPEILRKLSYYYDVPFIKLMDLAGYTQQEHNELSLIEAFGESTPFGLAHPPKKKQLDLYSILVMNADVYYKETLFNEKDKAFLLDFLERTFSKEKKE
ncbi:helix-turn-helix domain-containing protein [Planococcus dechangensis]|uniref:Helix-turn-helix domain-containing protein n=1 Tax=Planococcus dechangensis TaxID=1176255 RepID=A0ABV9MHJ8_9BACL